MLVFLSAENKLRISIFRVSPFILARAFATQSAVKRIVTLEILEQVFNKSKMKQASDIIYGPAKLSRSSSVMSRRDDVCCCVQDVLHLSWPASWLLLECELVSWVIYLPI